MLLPSLHASFSYKTEWVFIYFLYPIQQWDIQHSWHTRTHVETTFAFWWTKQETWTNKNNERMSKRMKVRTNEWTTIATTTTATTAAVAATKNPLCTGLVIYYIPFVLAWITRNLQRTARYKRKWERARNERTSKRA